MYKVYNIININCYYFILECCCVVSYNNPLVCDDMYNLMDLHYKILLLPIVVYNNLLLIK